MKLFGSQCFFMSILLFLGEQRDEKTRTPLSAPSLKGRCDIMIIFPSVLLCHLAHKLSKRRETEKTPLTMTRLYAARNEACRTENTL